MAQLTAQVISYDEEFKRHVARLVRACGVPVGMVEGRSAAAYAIVRQRSAECCYQTATGGRSPHRETAGQSLETTASAFPHRRNRYVVAGTDAALGSS